eukprot:gene1001-3831_t
MIKPPLPNQHLWDELIAEQTGRRHLADGNVDILQVPTIGTWDHNSAASNGDAAAMHSDLDGNSNNAAANNQHRPGSAGNCNLAAMHSGPNTDGNGAAANNRHHPCSASNADEAAMHSDLKANGNNAAVNNQHRPSLASNGNSAAMHSGPDADGNGASTNNQQNTGSPGNVDAAAMHSDPDADCNGVVANNQHRLDLAGNGILAAMHFDHNADGNGAVANNQHRPSLAGNGNSAAMHSGLDADGNGQDFNSASFNTWRDDANHASDADTALPNKTHGGCCSPPLLDWQRDLEEGEIRDTGKNPSISPPSQGTRALDIVIPSGVRALPDDNDASARGQEIGKGSSTKEMTYKDQVLAFLYTFWPVEKDSDLEFHMNDKLVTKGIYRKSNNDSILSNLNKVLRVLVKVKGKPGFFKFAEARPNSADFNKLIGKNPSISSPSKGARALDDVSPSGVMVLQGGSGSGSGAHEIGQGSKSQGGGLTRNDAPGARALDAVTPSGVRALQGGSSRGAGAHEIGQASNSQGGGLTRDDAPGARALGVVSPSGVMALQGGNGSGAGAQAISQGSNSQGGGLTHDAPAAENVGHDDAAACEGPRDYPPDQGGTMGAIHWDLNILVTAKKSKYTGISRLSVPRTEPNSRKLFGISFVSPNEPRKIPFR